MKDILLNQIGPVVIAAIIGIFVAIIKSVGDVVINYIEKKKEVVEQNLQIEKHKQEIQTAKEVWNIVDEKYRLVDKVGDFIKSKADDFDKILIKKIPYLTKEEITDIRQAIGGEINKGKILVNEDNIKQQTIKIEENNKILMEENNKILMEENNKILMEENKNLKEKLNNIGTIIPKEEIAN